MKSNNMSFPTLALLATTTMLVVAEIFLFIVEGYYVKGWTLGIAFLIAPLRFVSLVICLGITIRSIIKRQHNLFFSLSWILIAGISFIPKGHFDTLGALISIYNDNPEDILSDARVLLDEYPPMTHFSQSPSRVPLNNPIPKDNLPSSIQNMKIIDVLVLDDYVLFEKHGLCCVFRGFIAFREGADLWANEGSYTLLNTCVDCWRIRIVDGLYWYHADPIDTPIYVSPLE